MALLDYATAQSFGLCCIESLWTPSKSCTGQQQARAVRGAPGDGPQGILPLGLLVEIAVLPVGRPKLTVPERVRPREIACVL